MEVKRVIIMVSTILLLALSGCTPQSSSNNNTINYEDKIAELEYDNEELESQIDELESRIDELEGIVWDIESYLENPY